ncbi:hypothetical protein [Roseibium sp. MB-4]
MDIFFLILARCVETLRKRGRDILALLAVWGALAFGWQLPFNLGLIGGDGQAHGSAIFAITIGLNVFVGCAFAVSGHRLFLIGETKRVSIRDWSNEFRYLWPMLILMVGYNLFLALALELTSVVAGSASIFFDIVICLLVTPLVYRLSLILPAAAIGEKFSISDALMVSKGMGGPMMLVNAVLMLPLVFLGGVGFVLLVLLQKATGADSMILLSTLLVTVLSYATIAVTVSVLSSGYSVAKQRWFSSESEELVQT